MAEATPDVIVVGAGPTGLALAGFLGQHGVQVTVLERFTDIYPLPRAVHLDDEVYRILHSLGVGEAFSAITQPTHGLRLVDGSHRVLARFERDPVTDSGLPQANMFDQPELERLLRARLAALPSVSLRVGVEVEEVEQDDSGVTVRARTLADGAAQTLRSRFLVGCDGANSLVARLIGAQPQDFGFNQRWVVIDVRSDHPCGEDWQGVDQVYNPQRAGTFMRVGPDRYRWEFQLLEDESGDDYSDIDSLRPLIGPWIEGIDSSALELMRIAQYTFRARVAQRWRDRRLLIAGDAAHLTPPFIGQGMGAGIRDAANLAWKLAMVCHDAAPDALLETYAEERRPHATHMVRRAIQLGRTMTDGGVIGALRQWVVPMCLRIMPSLNDLILSHVTPPLQGALVSPHLPGSARGRLLPLVRIPQGDDEVLIDAALGGGFGTVALPGASLAGIAPASAPASCG